MIPVRILQLEANFTPHIFRESDQDDQQSRRRQQQKHEKEGFSRIQKFRPKVCLELSHLMQVMTHQPPRPVEGSPKGSMMTKTAIAIAPEQGQANMACVPNRLCKSIYAGATSANDRQTTSVYR